MPAPSDASVAVLCPLRTQREIDHGTCAARDRVKCMCVSQLLSARVSWRVRCAYLRTFSIGSSRASAFGQGIGRICERERSAGLPQCRCGIGRRRYDCGESSR